MDNIIDKSRCLRTVILCLLYVFGFSAFAVAHNGSDPRTTMFHGMELPYEVVDGWAVHAGDIILGTAEEAAAYAPERVRTSSSDAPLVQGLASYPTEVLWPRGIVPYVIDADVPKREWILEAIRIWNDETVVRFVERTTERDYLRFAVREAGCFGVFGRGFDGGEQIMPIEPRGCPVPITLHELGHAVGMWHEQQRKDRDRYMRVFRENINPGDWGSGAWHPHALAGADIGPYDYRSVMHYPFFSDDIRRHGHIRMAETIPPGMPMGQTVELSPGDIDSVARLYGHQPAAHVVSTNPAGLDIIVDGVRMAAPATFNWEPDSEHTLEIPSPQFRPGSRFLFGRWSDDGARAHTITATPDTTLYQASFIAQHQVSTSAHPAGAGNVSVNPASPDGYYTLRSPVELSASPTPDSAFRFLNWQVDTDFWWSWFWPRLHGESANPARTYVTPGIAYQAQFVDGPIFRIVSNVDPVPVLVNGGEHHTPVVLDPDWFSGSATISVEPIQEARRSYRHRFRSWSDGGDVTHSVMVPRDEDSTLTLTLDTQYRLSTNAWYGHEIKTMPSSKDGFYDAGTEVRLLAVKKPPEKFIGWSGGSVSGTDPVALVTMDTGRHVEAVFAAGTSEIQPGEPVNVSLQWRAGDLDHARRYVRVPPGATELEIQFSTRSLSEGAEAGLFVTHHRDPWPWDVDHADADRIIDGGIETITVSPPADGWPAAYFILVRGAESTGRGTRSLEGTLVARVRNTPVGALENPQPGSFQSGVGVISGWVCEADTVTIEFDRPDGTVWRVPAAYGTSRTDVEKNCHDTDNGFGLLWNWNNLGPGPHTVRALVDGVELAEHTITVTTLGLGNFPRGLSGEYTVTDFPDNGDTTRLQWQEARQNFVMVSGAGGGGGAQLAPTQAWLGNPAPASFQSGISVISGWVCEAETVEIVFENGVTGESFTEQAGYGMSRTDTVGKCGDSDNGFGLLWNWNKLGDGQHTVRTRADGVEFAWSTFTVTTLGEEFARGLQGEAALVDFPTAGQAVTVEWQEAQQNFVITNRE